MLKLKLDWYGEPLWRMNATRIIRYDGPLAPCFVSTCELPTQLLTVSAWNGTRSDVRAVWTAPAP